jgi:chromosome segregation ATPase
MNNTLKEGEPFDEKLCGEKHKNLDSILNDHEIRLNKHGQRLDNLEQESAELKTDIKHLCEDLKDLTSVLRWFIGVIISALLGFFFFAIQNNIFK